jgi:hypothetical protein
MHSKTMGFLRGAIAPETPLPTEVSASSGTAEGVRCDSLRMNSDLRVVLSRSLNHDKVKKLQKS